MILRLIGDVHTRYEEYCDALEGADYSLQVGDFGILYHDLEQYDYLIDSIDEMGVDFAKHRAIAGNHDNYQKDSENYYAKQSIFLGNYGVHKIPGFPDIFYVRGAWSIDHQLRKNNDFRTGRQSWWEEEEMTRQELEDAIALYKEVKPSIVVTHDAPHEVTPNVTNADFVRNFGYEEPNIRTKTNMALQVMFETHQPKLWVFGHFHRRWKGIIRGTEFHCLDMIRPYHSTRNPFHQKLTDFTLDLDSNSFSNPS